LKIKSLIRLSLRTLVIFGSIVNSSAVHAEVSVAHVDTRYNVGPDVIGSQQRPVIRGQVIDESGVPMSHVTLFVKGPNISAETNKDGMYTISLEKEGSYEISVRSVGYVTQYKKVSLAKGEQKSLDWKLLPDEQSLNQVTVAGKTEAKKIKDQGFNVDIVDAKRLYNSSADLNQVLNRLPGVRVREDGGLGSGFSFSLNGFSGKQVKFFLDGIPMDNFGSSLTLNNLPTTMVERVEVYKGVLPVTLGGDALGGAVNLVTRDNPQFLDVSYVYGSFNTHKASVVGAYTDKKSGFTLRANTFFNYSDNNYKVDVAPVNLSTGIAGPIQEVERFHDNYSSVGGQVEAGLTGKSFADKLLIGIIAAGNERDIQTGVTMDQVFGARTANSHSFIPTLKYKKANLFTEGLTASVYAAYNMTRNNFIDTTALRYNWLQESVYKEAAELRRTQLKNRDNDGLVTANLSYQLNEHHSLSYNYVLTSFDRKSSDVEDPDNYTFNLTQSLRKQNMGLAWQANYQGFTATAFSKLYLLHGESFENVSTTTQADYQPISQNKQYVGYGMASAYYLLPRLQVKASYERAYRLPEASEFLGDGLYYLANSAIKPERSHNFNLGALFSQPLPDESRLDVEGNFIYRKAEDYIRVDQARLAPVGNRYINVGKVTTTGGEAEVRYTWKNRIFASVNATYQNITDKTEFNSNTNLGGTVVTRNLGYGYKVPNIPYFFGNVNLGTKFNDLGAQHNTLSVNYALNFVEKYYRTLEHLGLNNQDIIPRQTSHDLSADYAMAKGKYTVSLEGRNLTDNDLFDNYRLQKPGRSFFIKLRYFINK